MVNDTTLNNLYELLLTGEELTTKNLQHCGFNAPDLTSLVKDGVLIREKRGHYSLVNLEPFYYYGKKLIAQGEYEKADRCFLRCFEIDPTFKSAAFQLFIRSVQQKKYGYALKYHEVFSMSDNPHYNKDGDFYLYLLHMIVDLPGEYQQYARSLSFENVEIDPADKRYDDVDFYNKVRKAAMQQKFAYAWTLLKQKMQSQEKVTVQDILVQQLLHQAMEVEYQHKKEIRQLAGDKKYHEIIEFLEKLDAKQPLPYLEMGILRLTKDIVAVLEQGKYPVIQVKNQQANNFLKALSSKDYQKAYLLNEENKSVTKREDVTVLDILLWDMNDLLMNRKEHEKVESIEAEKHSQTEILNGDFSSVVIALAQRDIEMAMEEIKHLLAHVNKSEYAFVIGNLIKLSLLKEDYYFTEPIIALSYLFNKGNYHLPVQSYLRGFYASLFDGSYEQSSIYLDLLRCSKNFDTKTKISDEMLLSLEITLTSLRDKNKEVKVHLDSPVVVKKEPVTQKTNVVAPKIVNAVALNATARRKHVDQSLTFTPKVKQTAKPVVSLPSVDKVSSAVVPTSKTKQDISFEEEVKQKFPAIRNDKSVIAYLDLNDRKLGIIKQLMENNPDMNYLSFEYDRKTHILLYYRAPQSDTFDSKTVFQQAKNAFRSADYQTSIRLNKELLAHSYGVPNPSILSSIGVAYYYTMKSKKAIPYLMAATALSKDKGYCDYSDLIFRLTGNVPMALKKAAPKMKESLFMSLHSKVPSSLSLENLEEVSSLVTTGGMDVDSACRELGLDEEKVDAVKLLCARDCFIQGDYAIGDKYLNTVEKRAGKTREVTEFLGEVRKNRLFYKNRNGEGAKCLVLKPHSNGPADS